MSEPTSPATASSPATRYESTFPTRPSVGPGDGAARARRGGGKAARLGTIVVMILALVVAAVTRQMAMAFQESHSPTARRTTGSGESLAGMDSYALALLLGGLRGPLVMILWANSEAQKAERDLEGIDTQIEWIRRLQPEFDTVHVFQMWNKAYNISVQMVGLSNKYTTILDAIDYGRSVDAERPDNLNILKEIARVYGDKLATSNPEKYYYRGRIRRETRHRELSGGAQRGQPGFQRLAHDPLLDPEGRILPQYVTPRFNVQPGKYDGSDLQVLKKYEPFPYGLSPFAIGYNYHKRGQMLMAEQKQKPLQISTSVLDSQPALALKSWAEEEWENGRRLEFKAFGEKLPTERIDQELPTADVPLDATLTDPTVVPELLYSYDMCVRLAGDSLAEYERHLRNEEFLTKRSIYGAHMDSVRAMRSLVAADRDYIKAMQATGDQRTKLLNSAAQNYRNAIRDYGLVTLRYYTANDIAEMVMPQGVTRATIGTGAPGARTAVTEQDILRMMSAVAAEFERRGGEMYDENAEDRAEYTTYIRRASGRLNQIEQATNR